MRLKLRHVIVAAAMLVLGPRVALAQNGAIAGTVKDTTGSVLPGVTVEASSPALIEKVRSVVSDGAGQYRIVDLRPGVYSVTFTLPGFSTVKREGIELAVGFTAPVNVEMRVGGVEETVVVSGESPVVDVQNVREQRVLTREVIDLIPTNKSPINLGALIPGMTIAAGGGDTQDVGGSAGNQFQRMSIHGGRANDQQTLLDGMNVAMVQSLGGSITPSSLGDGTIEQTIIEVSGHSAEVESGGVVVNMIPKDGGNQFKGNFYASYANAALQSNNYSEELRRRGLAAPLDTKYLSDVNPSFGGPVKRDRLWFFSAFRDLRLVKYTNAGRRAKDLNPNDWVYTPDPTDKPIEDQITTDAVARATWQVTPKNKLSVTYDFNKRLSNNRYTGALSSNEAAAIESYPSHIVQALWTSPVTSRLLIDAGVSVFETRNTVKPRPGALGPGAAESSTGQTFRAQPYGGAANPSTYRRLKTGNHVYKGSISYITGGHALKAGFIEQNGLSDQDYYALADYQVTLLNGTPNAVTYLPTPFRTINRFYKSSAFGQDQWTMRRLTVNAGLRYDWFRTEYPDYSLAATNILPARSFPGAQVLNWKDFSPRLGASYDVFGNGKTAIKASFSRYLIQQTFDITRVVDPSTASAGTLTRQWVDANRDFVPQGDPLNPATNGEIGPSPNNNFGRPVLTLRYDSEWASGLHVRPYQWETVAGVQHELLPRVSANVGYFRRVYGAFPVTDNVAVAASDYDAFCVTAPSDPRLPDNGGQRICGLLDLNPSRLGRLDQLGTSSDAYGEQTEWWHGVDMGLNARLGRGVLLQGGLSTGKTVSDNCDVFPKVPENGTTSFPNSLGGPYCRQETPYLTQFKLIGSYTLPWQVQIAGAYQSIPGNQVLANYVARNAEIAPSLGRNLSAGANATATVNLIAPGTVFGDRLHQVDIRFSKAMTFGRTRVKGMVDLYNLANANTILGWNNTYGTNGATWLVPTQILAARLIKFGVQLDF